MCCFFAILVSLGPRVAGVLWWLIQPALWSKTFDNNLIWPILGLVFLPWVTLMYVLVAPGGVTGLDWLWLGLALVADIAGYTGGFQNRDKLPMGGTPSAGAPAA
jgi:hypothetical protein